MPDAGRYANLRLLLNRGGSWDGWERSLIASMLDLLEDQDRRLEAMASMLESTEREQHGEGWYSLKRRTLPQRVDILTVKVSTLEAEAKQRREREATRHVDG